MRKREREREYEREYERERERDPPKSFFHVYLLNLLHFQYSFQVRVVQNKEPEHFLRMFRGRMIILEVRFNVMSGH